MKVDELLRLACIYAEQDRQAFVQAYEHMEDDPACVEAKEYLRQLRAYRMNRWGKTKLEHAKSEAKSVPISELRRSENPLCPKCQRPLMTVEDFRAKRFGATCPTGYLIRDLHAELDCQTWAACQEGAKP